MKASKLIERLQELIEEHGDLTVVIPIGDFGDEIPIGSIHCWQVPKDFQECYKSHKVFIIDDDKEFFFQPPLDNS